MTNGSPYHLSWASVAKVAIKAIAKKAFLAGRGEELIKLINTLEQRLRNDPLSVGEIYRTRGVNEENIVVLDFVSFDFAVDRKRKLVLVRKYFDHL